MKTSFAIIAIGLFGLLAATSLHADDALRHIQQSLRDQGFYYGPIDGSPGDETTQAIRRYQIRNGLGVTGVLNDETRAAIDKTGAAAGHAAANSTPPPLETPAPAGTPRATPSPSYRPSQINGDANDSRPSPPPRASDARPDLRGVPVPNSGPVPPNAVVPSIALTAFLVRTPYEFAPPPVQADIVRRVQMILLHSGFYDGPTDGRPSPAMGEALANYQDVNHLRRTGRPDTATLSSLRLVSSSRPGPPR